MQLTALAVEFSVHNILRKKYIFNFERFTEIKLPILTELIYLHLKNFEFFKYVKSLTTFSHNKRKTNFIK